VSISLSIGFLVNFLVTFYRVTKYSLEDNLGNLLKRFISPFYLGVIMLILLKLVKKIDISNVFISLVLNGVVFLVVLVLYIYFTKEKKIIIALFKK
ncbi:MAG: lipopolysaccharide biosynthesis protein, partial [Lactococcus sp.]|nr:lipopolysaccharide biosynthesis protein [Lactococcus sp.]